jgi:hypothetical protein
MAQLASSSGGRRSRATVNTDGRAAAAMARASSRISGANWADTATLDHLSPRNNLVPRVAGKPYRPTRSAPTPGRTPLGGCGPAC